MKHRTEARFPASPEVVLRMFTDRSFHTRKLEAMGLQNRYEVLDYAFDGNDFRIRIQRRVPVQAPGVVKKVVSAESTVVNEERWNLKSRTGAVKVEPQGMPLDMSCVLGLAGTAEGCVVSYDWTIKARIPVVGGALEKFVVADLQSRSAEEHEAAMRLLAEYR
ncbi:MAG: DUF2505 domain-containing protein [Nevskia sp.]|nr:DUF2505 domain-containing protein [Nevskia sp.]